MATTTELKKRIRGIQDTEKITNAMYLIASQKMRKAREDLERTRPYFEAIRTEIQRIFRVDANIENRYFYPPQSEGELHGPVGILAITADKGLAGPYNLNVIKEVQRLLEEDPEDEKRLFIIGEYGRRYCKEHEIPFEEDFHFTAQQPTINRARSIASILLREYYLGNLVKVHIVYTDMSNGMYGSVAHQRMLPFHRADFITETVEKEVKTPFDFYPSLGEVLDNIVPSYLAGFIYSALVDSFCTEQSSRMTAMDTASSNAEELIGKLKVKYNHVRQGAITQQITEISSGVRSVRNKKETYQPSESEERP
ncbi:MAG: ATP synthase F1 subunit gamma [Mogibacterium sp.]|nr:ATP synthase F1 subunit gamma [Mogibacterium sp.]